MLKDWSSADTYEYKSGYISSHTTETQGIYACITLSLMAKFIVSNLTSIVQSETWRIMQVYPGLYHLVLFPFNQPSMCFNPLAAKDAYVRHECPSFLP